jgi:hypothetical protein
MAGTQRVTVLGVLSIPCVTLNTDEEVVAARTLAPQWNCKVILHPIEPPTTTTTTYSSIKAYVPCASMEQANERKAAVEAAVRNALTPVEA